MQYHSEFSGPSLNDYANVLALNTAFIEATSELKRPQRGRLAAAPFLLFSLRENDVTWWTRALTVQVQQELVPAAEKGAAPLRRLQDAAISFLWQLARRNPYAARIISGASTGWCDTIIEMPLVTLLDRIRGRDDLMISRLDGSVANGERLLGSGTSSLSTVRRSSQLAALQALLTGAGFIGYTQLPAAACSMSGPLRVMDNKL